MDAPGAHRSEMSTAGAGYSSTPLLQKLGVRSGTRLLPLGRPPDYAAILGPLPEGVELTSRLTARVDIVHLFVTRRVTLARELAWLRTRLRPDAAVWVSWPKRSAGVATDVGEDTIRELALPLGFVDVKVCAVRAVWSGLRLVIRKALR
jgi:hypothetical protein